MTTLAEHLEILLLPYQKQIENDLRASFDRFGSSTRLREACEYSLLSGGKRFRPILVYLMASAIGKNADVSEAALAVEYFHTASLIADDLPCMDNDDERRNKPSLHKAYDEATALLASYALIAAGYEAIGRCAAKSPFNSPELCCLALESATYNTGISGATGGQYIDLFPPNVSKETLYEVILKKTVSLFEISFVLGWLFGGGDPLKLPTVKKAAYHFGMAFQIADDIQDLAQDSNRPSLNTAVLFGIDRAKIMVSEELASFYKEMDLLGINDEGFRLLSGCLHPLN